MCGHSANEMPEAQWRRPLAMTMSRPGFPDVRHGPIQVAIVCDNDLVRHAISDVIADDSELSIVGVAANVGAARSLLQNSELQVLVVGLPLLSNERHAPGIRFITTARKKRPDIGILSLKRGAEELLVRAAIDAGADACCLAGTPQNRLLRALKAVSVGGTWLDPEISAVVFRARNAHVDQTPRLTARERIILQYITEGYTNSEMADMSTCTSATIHTHISNLYKKLGVHDRASAAVAAIRRGLINENEVPVAQATTSPTR
jgi:NarL family two-component system response regulator LiaR